MSCKQDSSLRFCGPGTLTRLQLWGTVPYESESHLLPTQKKDQTMETHFDSMQAETSISAGKLKEDLRILVRDAEDLLRATASDMSEKAKDARVRLQHAITNAQASCRNLQAKTAEAAKAADKVVRNHPYEAIGVGFGVGLLVGFLMSRR